MKSFRCGGRARSRTAGLIAWLLLAVGGAALAQSAPLPMPAAAQPVIGVVVFDEPLPMIHPVRAARPTIGLVIFDEPLPAVKPTTAPPVKHAAALATFDDAPPAAHRPPAPAGPEPTGLLMKAPPDPPWKSAPAGPRTTPAP